MVAAATNSSTFPHFSSLPPELRHQIWREALPDRDGPALYPYRTGDAYANPTRGNTDVCNVNFEFRHDLLGPVPVEVQQQLVFVNREARGIALAWVREQGGYRDALPRGSTVPCLRAPV